MFHRASSSPGVATAALTLVTQGRTAYVIALAEDAIPAERTAADQLRMYLQQMTGAAFDVKPESEVAGDAPQILVGAGRRAMELLPGQVWNALDNDGIVIQTVANNLVLAGGRPRGTLYSVFEFLEIVGCRFWTSSEFDIPHTPTLSIEALDVVYTPSFIRRENHVTDILENPAFATIMRQNGTYLGQGEDWGGHFVQIRASFNDLLPPEKYFNAHPEWYTDAINHHLPCTASSKMPPDRKSWQLVTTNPDALEEAARQAIAWIERHPEADSIALWFNDNPHYCRDAESLAIIEKHGSPSALMLKYVNEMARRIRAVCPHILVEYQAYWWAVQPPRDLVPGPGVIVELAPIGSDFGYRFTSHRNVRAREQLQSWSAIAPMLSIYYYCTNFRWELFPHPNWFTFGPDFKFWAEHNVVGLFDQGGSHTGKSGDFLQLRTWLLAKLMWDPSQDQDKLMDAFLNGYYGAAGPYLKQYIRMVQDSFGSQDRYLGTYNADFTFMTLDVVNRGYELFGAAADAVKDHPVFRDRVRRERLSLDIVALAKFNYFRNVVETSGKPYRGPDDLDQAFAEFEKTAGDFGVTGFAEGNIPLAAGLAVMKKRLRARPTAELPEFARGYGPYQVIDFQPEDIHLYARGTLTNVVDDPAAPGGKAAMALGTTDEPAIQIRIGPYLPYHKNWRVYACVRADVAPGAAPEGAAFEGGVVSLKTHGMIYTREFPTEQVGGKRYRLIDMGVHDLDGDKEIRFRPLNKPEVTAVYVQRVLFIQEGESPGQQPG